MSSCEFQWSFSRNVVFMYICLHLVSNLEYDRRRKQKKVAQSTKIFNLIPTDHLPLAYPNKNSDILISIRKSIIYLPGIEISPPSLPSSLLLPPTP